MLLPNGEQAIVDIRKLRDYCLNPDNPRGSRKARVFRSALGMTKVDAAALRQKLLQVDALEQAKVGEIDRYGQRYTLDFRSAKRAAKGSCAQWLDCLKRRDCATSHDVLR